MVQVRVSVLTVGNELLYGETVDTNAAWLGRELGALGLGVTRRFTVGDVAGEIDEALRRALASSDLVIVTGGLGPTADDITKETVAQSLGRTLRLDEDRLEGLRRRFRARGIGDLPEPNRRQALIPDGALVLENRHGTAPGLLLEEAGATLVLLPGVPRELKGIFQEELAPRLEERFRGWTAPLRHRSMHTTGIPESRLAELLEGVLRQDLGPVTLAYLPDIRGVDLRLTAPGTAAEADPWLDRVEEVIGPVIAPYRFRAPSGDLAEAVVGLLRERGRRLAIAESCTGGLIAKRITDLPGASKVFVGGVVAYHNSVKTEVLGVSPEGLARHGAVSEVVVRQMALGVAERLGASAGIGITGIAGPGGGTPEKPVGMVWIAVSLDGRVEARLGHYVGGRWEVRERAAQDALWLLHGLLERG